LTNSPFALIKSDSFEFVDFAEYENNKENITFLYFDAFNQAQFNGQLNNLFAYLLTNESYK
jgi:hypothetical protein